MGGGGVRSFNLLRLREIAQQRDETARTFDGAGDEDDVANNRVNAKQSTASAYTPLRRNFNRNKSCSSFYSEDLSSISSPGRISAVVNLADGTVTDGGAEGDVSASDDESNDDDIYRKLTPIVTPAPRVTFVAGREPHPDLTVLPAKSASKPESPFVSPQKKRHLRQSKRVRSNLETPPTNSPDVNGLPAPLAAQHPSILSRHQADLESDMVINGIRSAATIKPDRSSSSRNRRKIGGGAVVSASPTSPAPRPQSLTPALTSFVQEGRTVGLPQQQQQQQHRRRQMASVVDFSKMADEESPEKQQQHVRRRRKQKTVLIKT